MSFSRVRELLSSNEKCDVEETKRIIENQSLYNAADASENTLLHHASEVGNIEIVQFLVNSGSKVDACNNLKQTPLMSALETRNPCKEVIVILLEARACIRELEYLRNSAVKIVNSTEWLNQDANKFEIYKVLLERAHNFSMFANFNLLSEGDEKMIKMLLQTNIDLSITDIGGWTLVHAIAQNPNPGIMALLRGKNVDVNARDREGQTPLMHAVLFGSTSAAEFLLDEGADVNAADNDKRTALYAAYESLRCDKKCIKLLLERGANAQFEVGRNWYRTIFDLILGTEAFSEGELVLAHLALQEAKETSITQLIYSKINSHNRFKTYFQECKQQLATKIYRSVTLFNILTASERKLERYLRDKELASKLLDFKAFEYFDTILRKRLSKTSSMIELRKTAAPIIGELMKIDYDSYPSIMDEVVGYFEEKDFKCLISMQN